MSKKFSGIWATFEYLDDTCDAIHDLKELGFTELTTHAPCPRHEIDHVLKSPESRVPFFTLSGAILGVMIAIIIITIMSLDWVLPVSAKSIVAVPIMFPIGFELAVLIAIYFTMGAMFFLILKDSKKHSCPQSKKYKEYDRFMRDRFGIVVPCQRNDFNSIQKIMEKYQAEEVNIEN